MQQSPFPRQNEPGAGATISKPRPFPLSLVDKITHFVKEGARMSKQYFNGAKILYRNAQEVKMIRKELKDASRDLTRKEFLLVKTTESDVKKLFPFFFTLLLVPESLPFFLIWMPSFFPSTCLTQIDHGKTYAALAKSRIEIASELNAEVEKGAIPVSSFFKDSEILMIASNQPQYFYIDNISSTLLPKINRFVGLPTRGPNFYLRNKLRKHFDLVLEDDKYLQKEALTSLTVDELKAALEARGISSLYKDPEVMQSELQAWLDLSNNTEANIPEALLVMAMALRSHSNGSVLPLE
ncbi:hypothetical protein HDU67_001539 [Dinochytrium kinnereticum]|nr:hypothetical protein HDU67_001539 [Dinochytrium kinnereticum]